MSNTAHVYPENDLIEHVTTGEDCPCNPTTYPEKCVDGSIGWLVVHHRRSSES